MVVFKFHEYVLQRDHLTYLNFMYMKPNNSGKDIQPGAETANGKLKQKAQTQDTDGMQAISVLNMTDLEEMSQQKYISWGGWGELQAPNSITFPLRLWPRKPFDISSRSHPVKFFFITSQFACIKTLFFFIYTHIILTRGSYTFF